MCLDVSEIVFLEEKNHRYMLLFQLKQLCKITKGVSSIFFVGDILTLIPCGTYTVTNFQTEDFKSNCLKTIQ